MLKLLVTPVILCDHLHCEENNKPFRQAMHFSVRVLHRITDVCILAHNPGTSDLIHYLSRQHHGLEPGEIVQTALSVKSWSEVSEGFGQLIRIFKPES